MRKVKINSDAIGDIKQAVIWYNKKQKGLGQKFTDRIRKAKKTLSTQTDFQKRGHDFHTMPISPFPYLIHYTIVDTKTIAIVAVLPTAQDPELHYPLKK